MLFLYFFILLFSFFFNNNRLDSASTFFHLSFSYPSSFWRELEGTPSNCSSDCFVRFLGYSLIRLSNCTDRPTIEPVPRDDEPVVLGPGQLVTVSFTREGSPSPTTDRIRPLLLSTRLRAEPTGRAWSRSSPIDCHLGSLSFRRKRSEFQSNEIVDYIVSILRDILFRIIQKITPKITPKITRTGVIRILVLYILFSHPVFSSLHCQTSVS